jgi:hypothetical protein
MIPSKEVHRGPMDFFERRNLGARGESRHHPSCRNDYPAVWALLVQFGCVKVISLLDLPLYCIQSLLLGQKGGMSQEASLRPPQ